MPTPSWTVSFITPTASNSPAKACAGHEANRTRRLDQPPSPVTQIHRPARLATRAASFRSGGRHHSGIPGAIIPLYPGDFVGIRNQAEKTRIRNAWDQFVELASQDVRPFIGMEPVFLDDKKIRPLQAAYLMAWQVREWNAALITKDLKTTFNAT